MSLETSYEVLEMLRDDGVQTFRAKEKTTGRGLELHLFLPFGRPENKVLFEKLKGLPLDKRRNFLDIGVDGSTPYLVTDPLPGNRGFKGWADELISGPQSAAAGFITGVMNAVPSRDDGVQILQAGQWRTGTPIPDSLITKPPAPAPPPPPPPQARAPMGDTGDFTRMFKPPDFSAMAQAEAAAVPVSAAPAASPVGEFTGFFQQSQPAPPAAKVPEPAKDSAPVGEFTGLFAQKSEPTPYPAVSIPQSYSSTPIPPKPAAAPISPPKADEPAPGEFTRMFQSPSKTGSYSPQQATGQFKAAPQPESPSGGQEFTKYFENPLKPAPMGSGSPQPLIDIPPPPPPSSGGHKGGEFTSVFGTPSAPPASSSQGSSFSFDSPMPQAPPQQGAVFGSMGSGSATGAFSAQPAWPQQQQAPPSFPSGPSEYTKMMTAQQMGQAPPQSVFNAAPSYAPPQQQAPAKKSNAVLFIAIGVVLLLILAIVAVLILRHPATIPATK